MAEARLCVVLDQAYNRAAIGKNAAPSSEGAAEKPFIRANSCAAVLAAGRHDRPCG